MHPCVHACARVWEKCDGHRERGGGFMLISLPWPCISPRLRQPSPQLLPWYVDILHYPREYTVGLCFGVRNGGNLCIYVYIFLMQRLCSLYFDAAYIYCHTTTHMVIMVFVAILEALLNKNSLFITRDHGQ